jgi:thiol-disulfide isomerase/thioredoxin
MRFMFILSAMLLAAASARALDVGDAAPPLAAETWLNGDAVSPDKPDGKTTCVVEFWATWCPPCKRSIPHLNELHDRLAGHGVAIIGVTTEPLTTVEPFVKKMEMRYRVAVDSKKTSEETWMEGVRGIPHAFIVDTNGVVVWAGHPMDGLEEALTNVLAGTYQPPKEDSRVREKEQELQGLLAEQNFDGALKIVEELIVLDAKSLDYYEMKLGLLGQLRSFDRIKTTYRQIYDAFQDSPEELNTLAWMAATSPFSTCDLDIAWKAAHRAADLTQRRESAILDTLARVHYAAGGIAEAMRLQEEALTRAANDKERAELQVTLDYYKSAAVLRETIAKDAAAQPGSP